MCLNWGVGVCKKYVKIFFKKDEIDSFFTVLAYNHI